MSTEAEGSREAWATATKSTAVYFFIFFFFFPQLQSAYVYSTIPCNVTQSPLSLGYCICLSQRLARAKSRCRERNLAWLKSIGEMI